MSIDLTDPIFNDEDAAWAHFETIRWPHGPICPHCGVIDAADKITGKTARAGLYRCRAKECRKQFTATVGTVYERSHIPMHKWILATHLLCASKKGMSAHQLWRMLGFGSYKTAWFMAHRIREGMTDTSHRDEGGLGGSNKVVEADETYIGGKAKNRAYRVPKPRKSVMTDEADKPLAVEQIPSLRDGISGVGSANAPFVYFDNAPFYGFLNGIGQIELEAVRIFGADDEGKSIIDRRLVAHLRGNLNAIRSLKAACDGILLMAEPKPTGDLN